MPLIIIQCRCSVYTSSKLDYNFVIKVGHELISSVVFVFYPILGVTGLSLYPHLGFPEVIGSRPIKS